MLHSTVFVFLRKESTKETDRQIEDQITILSIIPFQEPLMYTTGLRDWSGVGMRRKGEINIVLKP